MAPKGEGVLEWTEALESAFINILLEKFTRTHTTSWKAKDWEQMNTELEEQFPGTSLGPKKLCQKLRRLKIQYMQFTELTSNKFIKKNNSFKTFQWKDCKHYNALKELFRAKTATSALPISSTDPPKSPETYARMEEEFLAAASSRGKEPINLEEGSGDSDDPVHEVSELVVTAGRHRVRKRSSNTGSRLQECQDLLKCGLSRRENERKYTPPESKRSKSVTSPEKPAKYNIEEVMDVLNKMRPSRTVQEYVVASDRLSKEENTWHMFMCFLDEMRPPWIQSLLNP